MISIHSHNINTYFIVAITPLVQRIDTYSLKLEPKTHSTEIGLLLVISRLQVLRQVGNMRTKVRVKITFLLPTGGHFSVASYFHMTAFGIHGLSYRWKRVKCGECLF